MINTILPACPTVRLAELVLVRIRPGFRDEPGRERSGRTNSGRFAGPAEDGVHRCPFRLVQVEEVADLVGPVI